MSWLRNTSISFARQLSRSLDPRHDYEPQACYSSFCKHWQQAHDIIANRLTRASVARQLSRSLDPRHDYEPQACYSSFYKHWQQAHDIIAKSHACYSSFCKHWQQAHDIIAKSHSANTCVGRTAAVPLAGPAARLRAANVLQLVLQALAAGTRHHREVSCVVNHLEQLSTLLSLEARAREIHSATSPAECLEYLLSENLMDKLFEWAILTGKSISYSAESNMRSADAKYEIRRPLLPDYARAERIPF
ncbi:UPF0518 protein [Operophtera brumata]|uniref:UPF0518 protein n=1 Tax=Operophtera brumata TaxID=104452 RepID=A0A0L7KNN7_OPEBR|nr:UPF0518 protein [Operophtera brumata]